VTAADEARELLKGISLSLEKLRAIVPKLNLQATVDVGARISAIERITEAMDKAIRDEVESFRRKKPGEVLGSEFKAHLSYCTVARLDQKALKEEEPEIHAEYCKTSKERRIRYVIR